MTDEDQAWEIDDGDHDLDDEPDYDHYDRYDDYGDPPEDYLIEESQRQHERYLASLSPLGRLIEHARSLIWRHTWRWRARWQRGPARSFTDEPPF